MTNEKIIDRLAGLDEMFKYSTADLIEGLKGFEKSEKESKQPLDTFKGFNDLGFPIENC